MSKVNKKRISAFIILFMVIVVGIYFLAVRQPQHLLLTGIVTTDDVQVSSLVQGRLQNLLVQQGESVKKGQLLAVIEPEEWLADKGYYENTEKESSEQMTQSQTSLELLEIQTHEQIRQSQANLAMYKDQVSQAKAELEYAETLFNRAKAMRSSDANSQQDLDQARSNYMSAQAHLQALNEQVQAAMAALALAQANVKQVAVQKSALAASSKHFAASHAQTEKADVILSRTKILAPIDGVVDIRSALQGEVVTPGETIVTLVDPDNLWVRADVEESLIDSIRLGDKLPVRLPSGAIREGTIFFRGVDADYATQRDVSRTKRDIKTFEIRLRCDNSQRDLALGMTTTVILPLR
jgi:HlyD family secretion protein